MISIFCADVGSIRTNRFGWSGRLADGRRKRGPHPQALVDQIIDAIKRNEAVALGFECPLFVPVPDDANRLGRMRSGEGNRSWSAGAGTGALATGLVQVAWIAREICRSYANVAWTFDAKAFAKKPKGVLLWEAFVSGSSKSETHQGDAELAVDAFAARMATGFDKSDVTCEGALSLAGAALLFAGVNTSDLIRTPCFVVRA